MLAETAAHSRRTSRLVLSKLLSGLQSAADGRTARTRGRSRASRTGRVRISNLYVIFLTISLSV
jgi:hypothetical protein